MESFGYCGFPTEIWYPRDKFYIDQKHIFFWLIINTSKEICDENKTN